MTLLPQIRYFQIFMLFSMFTFVWFTTSCKKEDPTSTGNEIAEDLDVNAFEAKISETDGIQLLDVRTQEEYDEQHIEGAILVDIYQSTFQNNLQALLDKELPVAVYCKSGNRSSGAMDDMIELGFREIYNLDGGITAWIDEGKPVVK